MLMTPLKPILRLFFLCAMIGSGAVAAERGAVTNLPLPRFVSLKAEEGNARRGPSLTHRVDWVFKHKNMPLEVIGEYENWRRVRDSEGQGGWMHYSLLSGVRMIQIHEEKVAMRLKPNEAAATRAYALRGVIARLGSCERDWCEISVQGEKGWAKKAEFWGAGPKELRD